MKNLINMKRSTILIGLGSLNLIHGILHILQFIQSVLLVSSSLNEEHHTGLDAVLHSPILSIVWAVIGLITLYIGIKDFRHHKKCHTHE
jgi:hypothetical protein